MFNIPYKVDNLFSNSIKAYLLDQQSDLQPELVLERIVF
jgi:hypothetical protein